MISPGKKCLATQYSDRLLSFVLNSQLNTLPTPNNLRLWGSAKKLSCGLGKTDSVTFGHIMGGCPWVLNVENKTPNEDRYTWWHNNVLRVLCNAIICKVQQCNADKHKNRCLHSRIRFTRAHTLCSLPC